MKQLVRRSGLNYTYNQAKKLTSYWNLSVFLKLHSHRTFKNLFKPPTQYWKPRVLHIYVEKFLKGRLILTIFRFYGIFVIAKFYNAWEIIVFVILLYLHHRLLFYLGPTFESRWRFKFYPLKSRAKSSWEPSSSGCFYSPLPSIRPLQPRRNSESNRISL